MFEQETKELDLTSTPYTYNAILAYAADKGWGMPQGFPTREQLNSGIDLLRYRGELAEIRFQPLAPLPEWAVLPPGFLDAPAGST